MRRLVKCVAAFAVLATTQCGPAGPDFAAKEDAEAWMHRNVVPGAQCESLLKLKAGGVDASAVGQSVQRNGVPTVIPLTVTMQLKYGKANCSIKRLVNCDSTGKVQSIDTADPPCS